MKIEAIKKLNIPDKSGIYLFKKNNNILYIGKATSLKDRVKSYFGKNPKGKSPSYGAGLIETRGPIIVKMIQEADQIDFQVTDSVLEAVILEANLIKKYQPKYNTKEKSDKSFNYVCITKESLPKVVIVRGKDVKHSVFNKIFGPYTNGSQLKEALKIVRRIFPYIDTQSAKQDNFEFYRQLGLTPDVGSRELQLVYKKNINNLTLFFQGKKKKIIFNLKKEMIDYAKNKEFESANEIKNRIFALQHINDVSLIKNSGNVFFPLLVEEGVGGGDSKKNHLALRGTSPQKGGEDSNFRIEAYDIAHMGGKNIVGVMTVVENGEIVKSEYKKFRIRTQSDTNDTGALKEILERRLAHVEWHYPNLIVVDGGMAQINVAKKVLAKMSLDIPVVSVLKDERHKPKNILGDKNFARKYEREILLANSEAYRFAITYHKKMRRKSFLDLSPTPLHSNGEGKARGEENFLIL